MMGIEYIVPEPPTLPNHNVASAKGGCVSFSCEKHCHHSQRQSMRALFAFHLRGGQSGKAEARKRQSSHGFADPRLSVCCCM